MTYQQLKTIQEKNGNVFFDQGAYNLNLIGVRSKEPNPDRFNDVLYVAFRDGRGNEILEGFEFTTLPGIDCLQRPSHSKGCAMLVERQYRGIYTQGLHRLSYRALIQKRGEVQVYRDNNRDCKFDYLRSSIMSGFFGINIHKSANPTFVGKNSYGCQVLAHVKDFDHVMTLSDKQIHSGHGTSYSYTLLREEQTNG